MGRLEKFYNKEYSIKSIYVVKTALMTFVLGLIIYYLAGQTGTALSFVSGVLNPDSINVRRSSRMVLLKAISF